MHQKYENNASLENLFDNEKLIVLKKTQLICIKGGGNEETIEKTIE